MSSFNALNVWLQTLKEAQGNENIKVMLVGNKRDLEEDRQVCKITSFLIPGADFNRPGLVA